MKESCYLNLFFLWSEISQKIKSKQKKIHSLKSFLIMVNLWKTWKMPLIIFDYWCPTIWWAGHALPTRTCLPTIPTTILLNLSILPLAPPSHSSTSPTMPQILSTWMVSPTMLLSDKWAVLNLQPRCFSSLSRVPVHPFDQKDHDEWTRVPALFCGLLECAAVYNSFEHSSGLPFWQTRQAGSKDFLCQRFQGDKQGKVIQEV